MPAHHQRYYSSTSLAFPVGGALHGREERQRWTFPCFRLHQGGISFLHFTIDNDCTNKLATFKVENIYIFYKNNVCLLFFLDFDISATYSWCFASGKNKDNFCPLILIVLTSCITVYATKLDSEPRLLNQFTSCPLNKALRPLYFDKSLEYGEQV